MVTHPPPSCGRGKSEQPTGSTAAIFTLYTLRWQWQLHQQPPPIRTKEELLAEAPEQGIVPLHGTGCDYHHHTPTDQSHHTPISPLQIDHTKPTPVSDHTHDKTQSLSTSRPITANSMPPTAGIKIMKKYTGSAIEEPSQQQPGGWVCPDGSPTTGC